MLIPETTIAVLIAGLALTAYIKIQNALARGCARRKDVESPGSSWLSATQNSKGGHLATVVGEGLHKLENENVGQKEMESYKQLYYKLHHLEDHPEILSECREVLVSLLSETLSVGLKDPKSSILSIDTFSTEDLSNFLRAKDVDATSRWEEYLIRRKSGSPRELFSDKNEAKWWLKQAAPVKYVDGAWLGHINKTTTPFELRRITKNAWQVMSEELGDGDLAKNHVYVYQNLLRDIDAELPAADSADFISPRHGLNELRCWKAAVAQLLISLFPQHFLPEILGFNMAYESLPVHLLKTVKELRELKLNPYYFELHISIDNADSGHAAMAMAVAVDYINLIANRRGPEAATAAWKRVQAGYVLADGLPTTPESPSLKTKKKEQLQLWNDKEVALMEILAAKVAVAHKIHCNSRLKIGPRMLVDWLEPNAFTDEQWRKDFLHNLGLCKPWVIKGDSERSKLVKELSWKGKMFGSFTQSEVGVVKAWIDSLGQRGVTIPPDPNVYYSFVGFRSCSNSEEEEDSVFTGYPRLVPVAEPPAWLAQSRSDVKNLPPLSIGNREPNIKHLVQLWFASAALLESFPSVPTRAADGFGSAIMRVLRAQAGFSDEGPGVAGMDEVRRTDDGQAFGIVELGLEICYRAGLVKPTTLEEAIQLGGEEGKQTAAFMVGMGMRCLAYGEVLVGMSWGFMELHELLAEREGGQALVGHQSTQVLGDIARRERKGLEACKKEIEQDQEKALKFWRGVATSRRAIEKCFPA